MLLWTWMSKYLVKILLAILLGIYPEMELGGTYGLVEWVNRIWHVYTKPYYLALKKEGNSDPDNTMNGPGGHQAAWKKSVTEEHTLYVLTLTLMSL